MNHTCLQLGSVFFYFTLFLLIVQISWLYFQRSPFCFGFARQSGSILLSIVPFTLVRVNLKKLVFDCFKTHVFDNAYIRKYIYANTRVVFLDWDFTSVLNDATLETFHWWAILLVGCEVVVQVVQERQLFLNILRCSFYFILRYEILSLELFFHETFQRF